MMTVQNMVKYEVGHLGDDTVLLALRSATSQEKMPDIKWFQVGMTRDQAVELAAALCVLPRTPLTFSKQERKYVAHFSCANSDEP